MTTRPGRILLVVMVGLLAIPEADAKGPKGGRSAAPRASSPRRSNFKAPSYKAPKLPRAAAPARSRMPPKTGVARPRTSKPRVRTQRTPTNAQANVARQARSTTPRASSSKSAFGKRSYRSSGYGRGYRNRSYGSRRGYGRSQGNNRAIVSRLRSVHSSLARVNQSYNGHRVNAMHSIALAIRQLSHRSMVVQGAGFAPGLNNGANRKGFGANANARNLQPLTQARADARMRQALRTTRGIFMQLNNQGTYTTSHARARGHVQKAVRHLNTALAAR